MSFSRVNIQILHVSSRENATFVSKKPFFTLRQQVSTLLFQLRQLVLSEKIHYSIVEEEIATITGYLDHLNALPIASVFHAVQSVKGNEVRRNTTLSFVLSMFELFSGFQSSSPSHHLLHGYLEWRWLHLTTVLKIQLLKNREHEMLPNASLRDTEFEQRLKTFVYDMIVLAAVKFNNVSIQDSFLVVLLQYG